MSNVTSPTSELEYNKEAAEHGFGADEITAGRFGWASRSVKPISIAGTLGYALAGLPHQAQLPPLSIGFVSLIGLVAIAPISSLVSPLGARVAHALPRRWLEISFALFLLTVAVRLVASLFF